MKRHRTYSRYAREAAELLGKHIKLGRKARKLTEAAFAERLGVARATLQKIEKGVMTCEVGIVLEAAALAGVTLFEVEPGRPLAFRLERVGDKLALLPKRIRKTRDVDDAF